MFKLTLLRHAESEGNLANKPQGHSDLPLTPRGRSQAAALAARWQTEGRHFDAILSSPLQRGRDTATLIGEALGVAVEESAILIERDVGDLASLEIHTIDEYYANPRATSPYQDAFGRGGEAQWALMLRAGQALQTLLDRGEGHYLAVSHGGLLNALMYSIFGLGAHSFGSGPGFYFQNAGFADLAYLADKHRWILERFNDDRHLDGLDD